MGLHRKSRVRHWTRFINTKDSLPVFFKLPQELLDEILKYLPPMSRWLLAITCRTFYYRLGSVFQSPAPYSSYYITSKTNHLSRPRVPFFKNEYQSEHFEYTKLIRHLENARWKYCQSCSKLHPRSAWQKPTKKKHQKNKQPPSEPVLFSDIQEKLTRITYHMWEVYEGDEPSLTRACVEDPSTSAGNLLARSGCLSQDYTCLPWAGSVKICECISMAFHHRKQIIGVLNVLEGRPLPPQDLFGWIFFTSGPVSTYLPTYIFHKCPRINTPLGFITRATVFFLHEGNLLVLTNATLHNDLWNRREGIPQSLWPLPYGSQSRDWQEWAQRFDSFCEQPEKFLEEQIQVEATGMFNLKLKFATACRGSAIYRTLRTMFKQTKKSRDFQFEPDSHSESELGRWIHLAKLLDLGKGESPDNCSTKHECRFHAVKNELIFGRDLYWC